VPPEGCDRSAPFYSVVRSATKTTSMKKRFLNAGQSFLRGFVLILSLGATLPNCIGQGVILGPIVNPGNGYAYYLLSPNTWTASEAEAVALGGTLATVNGASENTWILNTFGPTLGNSGANIWIGFNDPTLNDGTGAQHAADFVWASGQPVVYTNWGKDEPDNDPVFGGEYYGILEVVPYSKALQSSMSRFMLAS